MEPNEGEQTVDGDITDDTLLESSATSNEDSHSASPTERVSYLPSWVLKMREKINTSREAHADTQLRINEINKNVDCLSAKLLVMRPVKLNAKNSVDSSKHTLEKASKVVCGTQIYSIPSDLLVLVLEYLQIKQVLRLEVLSRTFYRTLANSTYWAKIFPLCCPHLLSRFPRHANRNASCQEMKSCMQQYLKRVKMCTTFVQTMKDQRCVPKHRTVQPHRHTRQERQVTHPLPLFERSQSYSGDDCLIPTTSPVRSTSGRHDMIMSHAETLSSDFRSVAHRAMQGLLTLTSDVQDPVIYKLVADGATTVLTALLQNEEGALQNYSCGILANLLCWEARKQHEYKEQVMYQGRARQSSPLVPTSPVVLRALSVLFGMDKLSLQQVGGVPDQVRACTGLKMLTALLTSPTASINLAGSTQITAVNRGGGGGAGLGVEQGFSLRSTTSSVQGMCNKQASRALVTLLYPSMPVPVSSLAVTPLPSVGSLSIQVPPLNTNSSGHHASLLSAPVMPTAAVMAPIVIPEQLRSPVISALFTTDTFARPWQFTYFYKSGAVKDQFVAYLRFLPSNVSTEPAHITYETIVSALDCKIGADYLDTSLSTAAGLGHDHVPVASKEQSPSRVSKNSKATAANATTGSAVSGCELRGRGIDGIGTFQLTGHAEADISGWSWYFHKSYVPVRANDTVDLTAAGTTGGAPADQGDAGTVADTVAVTAQQWVQRVDVDIDQINLHSVGAGAARGAPVHVSHVGYWSAGVENAKETELQAGDDLRGRDKGRVDRIGQADNTAAALGSTIGHAPAVPAAPELDFVDESPSGVW